MSDIKNVYNFKFKGIDDWNRPVFKVVDKNLYFGDVDKLWSFNELGKNNEIINNYYKQNPHSLCYFGSSFNCEPNGRYLKDSVVINIIT